MSGFGLVDRALFVLRRAGIACTVSGWIGGAFVAVPCILAGYFEMIEGLRELRPILAAILVIGWWARSVVVARLVERLVAMASDGHLGGGTVRALGVVRSSSWVGLALWAWAWLPVLGSFGGWLGVVLTLPLLSIRGAFAPTWLARAGREGNVGIGAITRSAADVEGLRAASFMAEGLLLVAAFVLFVNLFAIFSFGTLLGRSFLGFDVTLVDAFLSFENSFVLVVVGTLSLALLEPARAAVVAVTHVEARARVEGFDLRAALVSIEKAHAPALARSASWAFLVALAIPAGAYAEPVEPKVEIAIPVGEAPPIDDGQWQRDDETQRLAASILDDPIFDDPLANRGRGIAEAIARWLESLDPEEAQESSAFDGGGGFSFALPPGLFYLAIAVLILGVVAWIASAAGAERVAKEDEEVSPDPSIDPRDRPPSAHLDAAAALAAAGDHRGALRSLYVATLVALDRRALIDFQPWRTNGHYVRSLPLGDRREALRRLTGLFDRTWYGDEPAGAKDYEEGRHLAEAMCAEDPIA